MSIAHDVLSGKAVSHYHKQTREVYYVITGEAKLYLGSDEHTIRAGDSVPIPVDTYHHLETEKGKTIELLVINSPPWRPDDVYLE